MGTEFQFHKRKRVLEMVVVTVTHCETYLTPLNCALKNDQDGKFYVRVCFTTMFLKEETLGVSLNCQNEVMQPLLCH